MFAKYIYAFTLVTVVLLGCSDNKEETSKEEETVPSAFENVMEESKELLLLLKNDLLVMDSTEIEAFIVSNELKPENNNFRSEIDFGDITLKKVFKCKNNTINVVHYDFYYDSLNTELEENTHSLLSYLEAEFGAYSSTHSSNSMKTYSWKVSSNTLDYELFKNGFTFTIRNNQVITKPIVLKKELPEQLKMADVLVNHIHTDSLSFESTILGIQNLFAVDFKGKTNALAFSETYNENILLSGSFLFDGDNLSGVYFDYIYSDSISKEFVTDAQLIKNIITELYDAPIDVATVSLSTSYKWSKTPIVLEVYGDGFSVIVENPNL